MANPTQVPTVHFDALDEARWTTWRAHDRAVRRQDAARMRVVWAVAAVACAVGLTRALLVVP